MTDPRPTPTMTRRRFLRLLAGGIAGTGAIGIGTTAYATRIEPAALSVTQLEVTLPHLPAAFDGFTIAQISDLHFGEWLTPARMQPVITRVNALQADLVVVTGDFVSVLESWIPPVVTDALAALRGRHGTAAVLGNHDHWTNAAVVSQAVQAAGVTLLNNAHLTVQRGPDTLYIAGVDDIWERKHDLAAALDGVPRDSATVLLAHEPDYADEVAATGRVGLQLSGHSHGGQVRLPGKGAILLPWLAEKYDQGLYRVGDMQLYVNRGVGMISPYVRLNCPPEITRITLRA